MITSIFVTFMVASALFGVWMLVREERLRIRCLEWQEACREWENHCHAVLKHNRKLIRELRQAREFNEVHGGDE